MNKIVPDFLLWVNTKTSNLESTLKSKYEWAKSQAYDIKRLFWATHDLHNKKSPIYKWYWTITDTIKTIGEYLSFTNIELIYTSNEYNLYIIKYKLNSQTFNQVIKVSKNKISSIMKIKSLQPTDNEIESWKIEEDVTNKISQYGGLDLTFQEDLTPNILGYNGLEIEAIDENFEKVIKRLKGDDKLNDFFKTLQ